jgi:hypothetical protein
MKKYTNKILIAALILFFAVFTVRFFIIDTDIKKEIKQSETHEIIINH